nr:MAG TPA: hypothetical protein [Caudoviricetes sp.]
MTQYGSTSMHYSINAANRLGFIAHNCDNSNIYY